MEETRNLIFIHGLAGSSGRGERGLGVKARLLRGIFGQGILTPDFEGSLQERMAALEQVLGERGGWTIIGSSFGGLMGALFACRRPEQVRKLILLAPALVWPDFAAEPPGPVDVPAVVYHGRADEVVPLEATRALAEAAFRDLTFHEVADDHGLYKTVHEIDWRALVGEDEA